MAPRKKQIDDDKMFTYEEYMKAYAPKSDNDKDAGDDADAMALALADETIDILKSSMETAGSAH